MDVAMFRSQMSHLRAARATSTCKNHPVRQVLSALFDEDTIPGHLVFQNGNGSVRRNELYLMVNICSLLERIFVVEKIVVDKARTKRSTTADGGPTRLRWWS